ncbi:hypothetical protein CA13_69370 [Planctomycetes bacterium CA13]|uniref:Uncharacterized protein n=1 Tax=Novipirellula herctigrandis TaxID=2527986 RepID=A0A5C5YNH7_9BACT|nr:hypothetical protein CA13_69370 [Planctomycetes bacterium CA13]
MTKSTIVVAIAITAAVGFTSPCIAQTRAAQARAAQTRAAQTRAAQTRTDPSNQSSDARRVTLTQTVEPSFHIEPIVHRFDARRGEVIPFTFLIRSTGKAMDVTVSPVKLRQEESGIILHDEQGDPADAIRFTSETEFELAPGQSHEITGELTIPLAKSNFLSYGVLVRDNGQVSADPDRPSDPNGTNASIRFVTQYVLRIDVETGEKDLSEMNQLTFEQGTVRSSNGMPVARTFLVNPTNFAFECSVRGEIESSANSRPTPFWMIMPSRVNLPDEQRYLVRIMPNSKVRLEAGIEDLLFPGQQTLKLSITNGRRSLTEESFSIDVKRDDYPALQSKLAYVDDSLSVEPSQIELGQIAGANRTCTLRFTNSSVAERAVELRLEDLQGNPLEQIRLSSSDFDVRSGRTKTVRATLLNDHDLDQAIYGKAIIELVNQNGKKERQELPLAMLYGKPPTPQIELAGLQSLEVDGFTSFLLAVTNQGAGYVPIHADLQVADEHGHAWRLSDGYGRWIAPGETRELRFIPEQRLVKGNYQLSLGLQTTPDQPAKTQTLIISLDPDGAETESVTANQGSQPAKAG